MLQGWRVPSILAANDNQSGVALPMASSTVTLKDAQEVAESLVPLVDPVGVILFGSVAKSGEGNDVDLLVVVQDSATDRKVIDAQVQHHLKKFADRFPIDCFTVTYSDLRQHFFRGSPFLRLIQREGRALYMKDAIRQWFDQSKDELAIAELLLGHGHIRGACFHAQQAVEKALKGALLQRGWELERTHTLRKLTADGKRYGLPEILEEEEIDLIDSVYRSRYPGEEGLLPTGEPSSDQARQIVSAASRAIERVLPTG